MTHTPTAPRTPTAPDAPDAAAPVTTASAPRLAHLPALDGLRGFAVLAILFYHLDYPWASGWFLSLDAFFVLSGYLITTLLILEWRGTGALALVPFWARRIRRLLPALLLVLIAIAIASQLLLPSVQLGRIRGDGLASLFYVANWRFIATGQSYFDLFTGPSPMRHLWSLALEEQFYLLWPIVAFLAFRYARRPLRVLTAVCVVGIPVSALLLALHWTDGDPSRAYFGTDSRMHTILIGCLLALVLSRVQLSASAVTILRWAGSIAAVIALGAWFVVTDSGPFYYRGGSLLYSVLIALVIAAIVQPAASPVRSVLSIRFLCWVGVISYGIYLWHFPLITFLTPGRTGLDGVPLDVLRLSLTFVIATTSFYLVERPIRHWKPSVRHTRVWAPVGVAFAGVVLVAATASASTPPNYLGGSGFINGIPCYPPAAELQAQAARIATELGPPAATANELPRELMIVGDSQACSLTLGMRAYGRPLGVSVVDASIIGCGAAAGQLYSSTDEFPSGTEHCQKNVRGIMAKSAGPSTGAIVWLSSWERTDQVVGGKLVKFRSDKGRDLVLRQMEKVRARLRTRTDAPIVMLTVSAPEFASEADGIRPGVREDDGRFTRLNKVMRRFAARYPRDVVVVDLNGQVCPGGPPCGTHRGYKARSGDGRHFTYEGAVWASRWLYGQLADVAPGGSVPAGE